MNKPIFVASSGPDWNRIRYRIAGLLIALISAVYAGWLVSTAAAQDAGAEQLVSCERQEENLLVCNPTDDTVDAAATYAPSAVQPAGTSVLLGTGTWLSVRNFFHHDTNGNSYTRYEYGPSTAGPWTAVCDPGVPGELEWRYCSFGGLTPGATYYLRQTYVDPDGVNSPNPLVLGPIPMPTSAVNGVTLRKNSTIVKDTHILLTTEIYGDANMNSVFTVDVATSSAGPWTAKCGTQASFAPKLCRVHSLTPDTDYYLRVTLSDPDGVTGTTPQIVGPVRYTGVANLALNKPITADPGWGCCSNPVELVNGRIQNADWNYGFAWTGGNAAWAGGAPGWKQATIDLGSSLSINRVDWWTHDPNNVPTNWKISVSNDGVNFTDIYGDTTVKCRTATAGLAFSWRFPACSHSARFATTSRRYVRYSFDDRTLLDNMHGWAVELEVFKQKSPAIRVRKYQDNNSDGWRDDSEPWLANWTFTLYNGSGSVVGTQVTNALGKASFINLPTGYYVICEEQKGGWYNTQPALLHATYNQPCYIFTVTWNSIVNATFGNSTAPPVVSAQSSDNEDGLEIVFLSETQSDPVNEIEEYDPWLDQPDEVVGKMYLPIMRR